MKKINNNSGVTLVALVITVILIAIIASTAVYLGGNIIKEARLQTTNTDMLLIEAKAETVYEKLSFETPKDQLADKLTGTKVTLGTADATNLVKAGIGSGDIEKYYLWDESTLKSVGLEGIKPREGELFYVYYGDEIEVVTSLGFKHTDGKTYYKLSEIRNLKIEE